MTCVTTMTWMWCRYYIVFFPCFLIFHSHSCIGGHGTTAPHDNNLGPCNSNNAPNLGPLPQWQSAHTTPTQGATTQLLHGNSPHKPVLQQGTLPPSLLFLLLLSPLPTQPHSPCPMRTWAPSPRLSSQSQWVTSIVNCILTLLTMPVLGFPVCELLLWWAGFGPCS